MAELTPQKLKSLQLKWLQLKGVVAVGKSLDQEKATCIKVYFSDLDALENLPVPDQVESMKVVKTVSGQIERQS